MPEIINRQVSHALLLASEDLAGIADLLRENYPSAFAFAATCSDGSSPAPAEFSVLLNYENPSFRHLTALKLTASTTDGAQCEVALQPRLRHACRIHIVDADAQRARRVADELSNWLAECRPLYSLLTRFSPAAVVAGALVLGLVLLDVSGGVDFSVLLQPIALVPTLIVIGLVSYYLGKCWKWLFPKVWFLLGRQQKEYARRTTIRNWIFGTIGCGLVIGVAGNLVTHLLGA